MTEYRGGVLRVAALAAGLLWAAACPGADVQASLDEARERIDSGDPKAAVIVLKNLLQAEPAQVDARVLLGGLYLRLGNPEAAEKEFRRASDLGAEKPRWEAGLGEALLRQGRFGELLEDIRPDAAQPDPHRQRVFELRGQAQASQGEVERALESFERALAIEPPSARALVGKARVRNLQGDEDAALALVDEALSLDAGTLDGLVLRAELLRRKGQTEGALRDYARAVELHPWSPRARLGLASVHALRGDLDQALTELDRLDERVPDLVAGVFLRALVYARQGRLGEAEEQVQLILRGAPEDTRAQLLYGVIAYGLNKLDLAGDMLGRAAGKLPEQPAVSKLLGAVRLKLGDYAGAEEALERAQRAAPEDPQILALLGTTYLRQGRSSEATEMLDRAAQAMPDLGAVRAQMALGLLAQGETAQAITELKSAVELDPELVQADLLLVLSHLRNGDYDKALAAGKDLERRQPENPVAYNLTGLIYKEQGEPDKARERFRKALELDPGFSVARLNLARLDLAADDLEGAESHYREVLERDAANLTALVGILSLAERRGDQDAFERWLALGLERRPESLQLGLIQARYLMGRGETLKALSIAARLSQEHPDNPAALELLGRAQLRTGRAEDAASTFGSLLVQLPGSAEAYRLLGVAEAAAGNLTRAREHLEKALELEPDHVAARVSLAELALKDGEPGQALAVGEALRNESPDQALGYEVSGAALMALDRTLEALAMYEQAHALRPASNTALILSGLYSQADRPVEGRRVLEDWLTDHPDDIDVMRQLAMVHLLQDRSREAIDLYERVLESSPEDSVVVNNLAWLYFQEGDERALSTAERAYALAPNKPEILDTYGWILLNQGQHASALNILQQALLNAPHSPEIAYHTAYALREAGRDDEARRLLRRLVGEHPDSDYATQGRALLDQL